MTAIQWENLLGVGDWAETLDLLLASAEKAVTRGNAKEKIVVQELLIEFMKRSPAACKGLDDIASRTASDLFLAQLDSALRSLAERRRELQAACRLIDAATEQARHDARGIQFRTVVEMLERTRDALQSLKKLEAAVHEPDRELLERINTLLQAIDRLRAIASMRVRALPRPSRSRGRRHRSRRG